MLNFSFLSEIYFASAALAALWAEARVLSPFCRQHYTKAFLCNWKKLLMFWFKVKTRIEYFPDCSSTGNGLIIYANERRHYNITSSLIGRAQTQITSSNGNTFRVTDPLCGEFTGPGECPAQRPVTRSFHVFVDLCLNKRLSKQSWGWWFETPSR